MHAADQEYRAQTGRFVLCPGHPILRRYVLVAVGGAEISRAVRRVIEAVVLAPLLIGGRLRQGSALIVQRRIVAPVRPVRSHGFRLFPKRRR